MHRAFCFSLVIPLLVTWAGAAEVRSSSSVRIMPLGDSITYGTPNPNYGGYRNLLGRLLAKDGDSFEFVGSQKSGTGVLRYPDNEGHPNWTITQIKNGIDSKGWLESYQPDIILLHIGTNDIRFHQAASAPENLSVLVDDILSRLPQVHIIVAQIIPFRQGPDEEHRAYNAIIPGVARSKGARVSVVNMVTALSFADYADGLHPNSHGYDKMARVWEYALRELINRRATLRQRQRSAPQSHSEKETRS